MNKETSDSFWSREHSFKLFNALIENRLFSRVLLVSSVAGLVISLLFDWGTFLPVFDSFKIADLYKISLFAQGISPYSSPEVWLAPYPPFYFMTWVVPYFLFSNLARLSLDQTYFGIRAISAVLSALCGLIIYKQLISQSFSKQKSLSLSSISVLSSLSGLIGMTGDFIGLAFLALGCFFLMRRKMTFGVLFVSLAVAFKLQPIVGLALLLLSLALINFHKDKKIEIIRFLSVVVGVGICLGAIPILVIPDAFSSFFVYDVAHFQYYFFNTFAGLVDVLLNLFPVSYSGMILTTSDIAWWVASISFLALLLKHLLKERFLSYADPIDIMSLGTIVWLIILKQTQPHYFLWALLPLLAKARTRSVLYVLAGEFLGSLFFGIGYLFHVPANFIGVPNIDTSVAFLIGGVIFAFFLILAMVDLLQQAKKERVSAVEDRVGVLSSRQLR
jgi:hypothetical protein